MADNDLLLDQIRKIVREENEPIKKDLQDVKQDIQGVEQRQQEQDSMLKEQGSTLLRLEKTQQEQGSMLSTIKSIVEATAEGQQELQKTAAREVSVQDVKATLARKANDYEERITELEKDAGIPHPHKH